MAALVIENVSKAFGAQPVLRDVSITVKDGEFLTLIGSSGCGKSTILRVIAGLESQDAGSVRIGARAVDDLRPKQRNVAMVFQSYALYPHMSVRDNIAMPLIMQRLRLAERLPLVGRLSPRRGRVMAGIGGEVDAVARQLHIEQLLDRKPAQLSGGQRQRVALGRAMVRHPDVFLMDEPLSNLDAKLRVHMRTELTDLHRRLGVTFIYVTHDQVEAMTMSDRVALMDEGRIVQLGAPTDLYHDPLDLRVARFIGSPGVNVLPGLVTAGGILVAGTRLSIDVDAPENGAVQVGIRPEALTVEPEAGQPQLSTRLTSVENLGVEVFLHLHVDGTDFDPMVARVPLAAYERAKADGRLGERVVVGIDPARAFVFDMAGHRLARRTAVVPALRNAQAAE